MTNSYLFTSESVSAGHPDKLCDSVSDTIVDAIYKLNGDVGRNRAAIETLVTRNFTVLAGEVSIPEDQSIDYVELARQTIRDIGYTDPELEFDANCEIVNRIHKQSPEIAVGVDQGGAGDQGMMFGFATNETPEFMPLPITLAHKIIKAIDEARLTKTIPFLRPDGKTQVTVKYENGKPVSLEKVVVAVPHHPDIKNNEVKEVVFEEVISPLIAYYKLPFDPTEQSYIMNGTGIWTIGGPVSDSGLTGRKIIVDTYGGMGRHGGGAFSGKDPSKVDRSAAYAARHVAKNLVSAGVADRLEIQLAYVIGHADPVSVMVETFGTGKIPEEKIVNVIRTVFDLRPGGIIKDLDLYNPRYRQTAAYGHFGRNEDSFTWEKLDRVDEITSMLG
ncbi:MAG: methionine adenosyltransferase [Calditrichae bacterium]|nr:methionine adenosyltransferase [Calditrichia bacterium]NIW78348.1 methionine adenosyltransferase [Calditrichia bacterium]